MLKLLVNDRLCLGALHITHLLVRGSRYCYSWHFTCKEIERRGALNNCYINVSYCNYAFYLLKKATLLKIICLLSSLLFELPRAGSVFPACLAFSRCVNRYHSPARWTSGVAGGLTGVKCVTGNSCFRKGTCIPPKVALLFF